MFRNSGDERRRERERIMVEEGLEIWRRKKEAQWDEKKRELDEMKGVLPEYSPWGRPGCGAPNQDSIRKRKLIPEIENNKMGGGNVLMGRPGGGAPHRTKSGHLNVLYKADPILRFQFHDHTRRTVDNELRYRVAAKEQLIYKQQLDKMVNERHRLKMDEMRRAADYERKLLSMASPWGKMGPGGAPWRHPRTVGFKFLHSLGWSNETALRQVEAKQRRKPLDSERNLRKMSDMPKETNKSQPNEQLLAITNSTREPNASGSSDRRAVLSTIKPKVIDLDAPNQLTGGIELVPLLTRRRAALAERHPLSTTDVTHYARIKPGVHHDTCIEYIDILTQQVNRKQQLMQLARKEEIESCKKHFDTWQNFWGRPGHGAPQKVNVMRNLDVLLRQIPCK